MAAKRKNGIPGFAKWADGVLEHLDVDATAYSFNIHEDEETYWVELVATSSFDEEDEDWACDEIYASRDDDNELEFTSGEWEEALEDVENTVKAYLETGTYAAKLKQAQAVACGFVDGDMSILYKK